MTVDQHRQRVMRLLSEFADKLPAELNAALHAEATPEVRREQVAACVRRWPAWRELKSC